MDQRHLYAPAARPVLVDVPRLNLLVIEDYGERYGPRFRAATKALYVASSAVRRALATRYSLPPPEGLWPGAGPAWCWRLMMRQPPQVTPELVKDVVAAADGGMAARVRLESRAEGLCAQALHVGPYREVKATVDRMLTRLWSIGYELSGEHHEIYLSNPQRTAPEKLKTIVRYPVRCRR